MHRRFLQIFLLLLCVLAAIAIDQARVPQPGDPLRSLSRRERDDFEKGRAVFERAFLAGEGLGPLFNAESCAECHEDPVVGGTGDEIELHATDALSGVGCDLLTQVGGPIFQLRTTPALREKTGLESEPLPAGATVAQRTAPDVFGFGLLDAVADSVLLSLADPDDRDRDGISGRPNRFIDGRIGRFGRKAFLPTLAEFNAGAFLIEQGITVPGFLDENSLGGEPLPPGTDPAPEPELDAEAVRVANAFVRFLAPPARQRHSDPGGRGEKVFATIRCDACHVPVLHTGASEVDALRHRKVAAYTDLLLHDMGPELADICFGDAQPAEFRTEPLMGLRFTTRYLHDGRAATVEEAIRAHGGEATGARDRFLALAPEDRAALLAFLASL